MSLANRATLRVEGVGYNLCRLPACDVVVRPEVRSIARWNTWLARTATVVPTHYSMRSKALYLSIERVSRGHILKRLSLWWVVVCSCVSYYLGGLGACSVTIRPEVRPVVHARLARAATFVSAHMTSVRQTIDPLVERMVRRYILEYLRSWAFVEIGGIRHDFG